MAGIRLTAHEIQRIRDLAAEGKTIKGIAAALDRNHDTIKSRVRSMGIPLRPAAIGRPRTKPEPATAVIASLTPGQVESIEAMIASSRGTRHIAHRMGLAASVVADYRVERKRRLQREKERRDREATRQRAEAGASEKVRENDSAYRCDGRLLTALRAHHDPLPSLPAHVAAMGVPVLVRRAA